MDKEFELEAEKYYKENVEGEPLTYETPIHCFIAGATSDAAKQYWYNQFEKQKLEFAIEQLKSFDLELQKYELSSDVLIFNKLKELEQKLSEL